MDPDGGEGLLTAVGDVGPGEPGVQRERDGGAEGEPLRQAVEHAVGAGVAESLPQELGDAVPGDAGSFERRELDFQIDVERRRVEDARLNDQYNQRMMADYQARERAILDRLNEANRIVRDSERESAPRLRTLRAQVESEEAKLRNLRGVGVPAAEIEARHHAIRIAELKRHRAERIAAVRAWESSEVEVTVSEAGAERLWRRWLTVGSEPEYVPQVLGGLPLP